MATGRTISFVSFALILANCESYATFSARPAISDAGDSSDLKPDSGVTVETPDAGSSVAANCPPVFAHSPRNGGTVDILACGQALPLGVTVDSRNVYWSDYGSSDSPGAIIQAPIQGGTLQTLASSLHRGVIGVAVGTSNVFWTQGDASSGDGLVGMVPIGGGAATTIAAGLITPRGIAASRGSVYWVDYSAGTVLEAAAGGSAVTTLVSGEDEPIAIAVEGANAYWVDSGSGIVAMAGLSGGGSPMDLASASEPTVIAVDGQHVYWNDQEGHSSNGFILEEDLGGGVPLTLAKGQFTPDSIAVDDQYVYWGNWDGNNVMKVSKEGGTPVTLLDDVTPSGIAVDATSLYWTDSDIVAKLTPK